MWPSAMLNNIANGRTVASFKAALTMRYMAVPNSDGLLNHGGSSGGGGDNDTSLTLGGIADVTESKKIILPLDVEDTVTCFCRLVGFIFLYFSLS